jgi:hypothetical protein
MNFPLVGAGLDSRNVKAIAAFTLSWNEIMNEFRRKFDEVYATTSSKAHLDMSVMVVDGAKEKWCFIMLLDTLVAFTCKKEKRKHECERRRFDQYTALKESVMHAATKGQLVVLDQSQMAGASTLLKCTLCDVNYPWNSVDNLREGLVDNHTSKSWRRRYQCVHNLCNHPNMKDRNLIEILTIVIERILLQVGSVFF